MTAHRAIPVLVILATLGCASARAFDEAGNQAYSIQMHIHGHSNHNASPQHASLQWHTAQAAQYGVDVLWWSEHSAVFENLDTLRIEPARGSLDPRTHKVDLETIVDLERPSRADRSVCVILPELSGRRHAAAEIRDGYLYCGFEASPGTAGPGEFLYRATGERGPVRVPSYTRPIVGGAVAAFAIDCPDFPPGLRRFVEFELSHHYYERPVRYRVRFELTGPDRPRSERVEGDTTAVVTLPCAPGRSEVLFDLEAAASLLRDGEDDCIQAFSWGIASEAVDGVFGVGDIRIWSTRQDRESYGRSVREIFDKYEREYGVKEIRGGEYSFLGVHLNAYLPDSTRTADMLCLGASRVNAATWAKEIVRAGGEVSYNHPFGAKMGLIDNLTPEIMYSKVVSTAQSILRNRAYGAEILEVGYVRRGLPLRAHLALWDYLTAHGLLLYGDGTSDAHGGIWFRQPHGNHFHTWIWAKDRSADSLLRGMKAGRMYFGDLSRWDGEFDFWVGPYAAGARTRTVEGTLPVRFRLEPMPEGSSVRLVQGLIGGERLDVRYVVSGETIRNDEPLSVPVDEPCFVRLEVYLDRPDPEEDVPLIFSNPVVFTDDGEATDR